MASYDQFGKFYRDTDADNSGYVDGDELLQKLKACGYKGGDAQIKRMFAETDTSGDGLIAFDEYMLAMGFTLTLKDKGEAMRRIFYEIDEQNTGRIHYTKIEEVLEQLKRHFFRADLKRIRQLAMDMKDAKGYIVTEDFLKKLMYMKIIVIEDFEMTGGRYSIQRRQSEAQLKTTVVTETTTTTTNRRTQNVEEVDVNTVNGVTNGDSTDSGSKKQQDRQDIQEAVTSVTTSQILAEPCRTETTYQILAEPCRTETTYRTMEQNNNKKGTVSVKYSMHYWPEDDNRALAVLGNIPELGEWDPSRAVKAQEYKNTGWWTVNIDVIPESSFEWKWVVIAKDRPRVLRWEIEQGGKNRETTTGVKEEAFWFPWKDWSNTA